MIEQASTIHPTIKKLFQGRKVMVCTMHGKELIMKPLIKQYLNLTAEGIAGLDTDEFGTFSGEVERPFDPVTTLRKKILKGLERSGETLGIGNEGSFGPHPQVPFLQNDQEIVMFIDLKNDIEVFQVVNSSDTNHSQKEITGMKDLLEFAERIHFPSHGMIVKQMKDGKIVNMRKGIVCWELLHSVLFQFASTDTTLIAESDMRAYLNPTRMKTIERATELLMKKIVNTCPDCQWLGFTCVETKTGLPCSDCGKPTNSVMSKIYACQHCGYTDERFYPAGQKADAQFCDHCNP